MLPGKLHCCDCARRYPAPAGAAARFRRLHCRECGGLLSEQAPEARPDHEKDRWRGATVGGVQLRELLREDDICRVYRGFLKRLSTELRVELYPEPIEGEDEVWLHDLFRRAAPCRDLRSPQVVAVTDIGRVPECYYIVSEHQPFRLRDVLDRQGTMTLRRVLSLADDVLRGLVALHDAGLWHGKVTPDGILVAHDRSARLDHTGTLVRPSRVGLLTVSDGGGVCGRELYAAPEAAPDGSDGDIRSDIYSLGATLYEMAVGRPPFVAADAEAVREQHCRAERPDAATERPGTPSEFCRLVAHFMAPDPAERPQTPSEALKELRSTAQELSRKRYISPVRAALGGAQRLRARLKWGGVWSAVGVVLVLLSVVPLTLLVRGCREEEQEEIVAAEDMSRRTLVIVAPAEGAGESISADEHLAVRTLLAFALQQQPGLTPFDRSWSEADPHEGESILRLLNSTDAQYALVATYSPGLGRRKWGLVYKRLIGPSWTVVTETAVPDDSPDGLAPMDAALAQLLAKAGPLMPNPPSIETVPARPAGVAAWVEMAAALRAERLGDWDAALEHAGLACAAAPEAQDFAVLRAFYRCCAALEEGEPPPAPNLPDSVEASPELASVAAVLRALSVGRDATERAFAALVTSHPRSVRCYYLLGMWRWRFDDDADGAAAALVRAEELDGSYEPARRTLDLLRPKRHEEKAGVPDLPAASPDDGG